jgi:transcriptional regulator with XRE-family HTH domain
MKRSQQKLITKFSKVLRYMRVSRRISMREAARRCDLSVSAINHYEHGRMDIPDRRLVQLVSSYGYTLDDFHALASGGDLPVVDLKNECQGLLELIDEKKLKTVHAVLTGFLT